ncbi:hypothetical protein BX600DRAFT_457295 [Xylariales sp. PMI_506]|nr:hypothetical protein BX600DRAFT_457295 [Xylariales sp. PMI_506]
MDQDNYPIGKIKIPSVSKACLQCRRVKMKCRPVAGLARCERCARKSMECVFHEQKKRGRKPMRRLHDTDGDTTIDTILAADGVESNSPARQENGSSSHDNRNESLTTINGPSIESPPQEREQNEPGSEFLAGSVGLQPSSLLNRQAMKGKFSLQNLLSTNHNLQLDKVTKDAALSQDDPINRGLVSYYVATSLYEGFMKSLNPFVCVLDPVLHTFQYVRQRSSFLMTVILAASAKAFNPALHLDLHQHAEKLLVDCFATSAKSPEVIQAMMLNTYWKQPDDTRSWSCIGYTIRLCMELGWHKLPANSDQQSGQGTSELEVRQRRNIERTWLVLFVYDRSMSLQTGKPWMIERSEFIESVNLWYRKPLATSNDAMLSALVTLRLASADIIELFSPQRPVFSMAHHPYQFDSLLKTLTSQIEAWRLHWVQTTTNKEPCHPFLVKFFGTHLLLLLYSFQFQASISSPIGASLVNIEAFWITYTNALEMLKLVSDPSLSPQLNFVHDSIHTMTAYAAVYLIKLLLSVNKSVRQEFESSVLETIENAARVFEQQATPPTYTCALQANFLKNVLQEYQKACRRRLQMNASAPAGRHPSQALRPSNDSSTPVIANSGGEILPALGESRPNNPQGGVTGATDETSELFRASEYSNRTNPAPNLVHTGTSQDNNGDHDYGTARSNMTPRFNTNSLLEMGYMPSNMIRMNSGNNNPSPDVFAEASPEGWPFTNEEEWAAMFMNAGFDIGGGVFVPN